MRLKDGKIEKKINNTKSYFSEKINKIHKPLARQNKTQIINTKNEIGFITTDPQT